MSEEGISAFEVSEGEERPMREVAVERKRYLHITIVDHNIIPSWKAPTRSRTST